MQRDENGLTFTRPQLELKLFSSETERLSAASTGTTQRRDPYARYRPNNPSLAFTAH